MAKSKILYHYFYEEEETDVFFEIDPKLKLVTWWSCNDALWRPEYMSGLIEYAGLKVLDLPKKYESQAKKMIKQETQ